MLDPLMVANRPTGRRPRAVDTDLSCTLFRFNCAVFAVSHFS